MEAAQSEKPRASFLKKMPVKVQKILKLSLIILTVLFVGLLGGFISFKLLRARQVQDWENIHGTEPLISLINGCVAESNFSLWPDTPQVAEQICVQNLLKTMDQKTQTQALARLEKLGYWTPLNQKPSPSDPIPNWEQWLPSKLSSKSSDSSNISLKAQSVQAQSDQSQPNQLQPASTQ